MKNRALGIVTALALVGLAAGVVRPQAREQVGKTWQPVVDGMTRLPARSDQYVELSGPADYILFLEGPGDEAAWAAMGERTWVELVDTRSHQPAKSTPHGASYEYELGARRGRALARVSVPQSVEYRLEVSGEPDERFQIAIGNASAVDDSAWRASVWNVSAIALCVVFGLGAILSLRKGE